MYLSDLRPMPKSAVRSGAAGVLGPELQSALWLWTPA